MALIRSIDKEDINTEILIVTGLPVEYYGRDKMKAEENVSFVAEHLGIKLGGVRIIPQPIGTFYEFLINQDGSSTRISSLQTGRHC